MFFIPTRDGIEFGKVGIRDGIEFRSKISGRDAKNPGIFGTGWDRDWTGSITSIDIERYRVVLNRDRQDQVLG